MSRPVDRRGSGEDSGADPAGGEAQRPAGYVEVILVTFCYALFGYLHTTVGKDAASATANADVVQSVERVLHVDIERATNEWLSNQTFLAHVAVYFYRSYYLVIAGVLVWVFFRHPAVYLKVRRTLLALFFLVLPIYWALPLSPPRFALAGTVDIVALYDPFGIHASPETGGGHSHYTAMPSVHVALSAWCAYAVWSALRTSHARLALLAWLFPLAMTAVVFATANHYVLDVVGSAVLLIASIAAASAWGRVAEHRHRRDS